MGKVECGAEEPKGVFFVVGSIRAALFSLPVITGWGLQALRRMNQPLEKNRYGRERLSSMETHLNCIQSVLILTVTPEIRVVLWLRVHLSVLYVCGCVCISIIIKDLFQNLLGKAVYASPHTSKGILKLWRTYKEYNSSRIYFVNVIYFGSTFEFICFQRWKVYLGLT